MEKGNELISNDANASTNAIVIDDEEDVRDLFVELLKMNSIDIVGIGSNGKDALELYKIHRPNFVFIDYLMPVYDGLYGAEKIKEIDPHAKIILVSGSDFEKGRLDNLVSAILKKPIEISEVVKTVNKMTYTPSIK